MASAGSLLPSGAAPSPEDGPADRKRTDRTSGERLQDHPIPAPRGSADPSRTTGSPADHHNAATGSPADHHNAATGSSGASGRPPKSPTATATATSSHRRLAPIAFRLTFTVYAAGLACWLLLGLLPTLAETIPALHTAIASLAAGHGPFAGAAGRILHPDPDMLPVPAGQALLQYGFSVLNGGLGLLMALRRPDSTVPRLLAFALVGTAATFNEPSHRAFHITGSPWPVAVLHFSFHIVSGVSYLWAVLLFPDGRLPGRIRLSPVALTMWVTLVTAAAAIIGWQSSFLAHPQFFVVFFGIGISLVGVTSTAIRLRDPDLGPAGRSSARLLCAALLPALATALFWCGATIASRWGRESAADLATDAQNLFPIVFALVPVVLFTAVLRYRLWDIDRLVGRVLVYGSVAAVVAIGYLVAVAAGSGLVGGGTWWTVLVLSLIAVAVEPLRYAAARWANRVVYGRRISPSEAMAQLLIGLQQFSPGGGLQQVAAVTVQATRARSARLYAVDGSHLVPVATAPPDPGSGEPTVTRGSDDSGEPTVTRGSSATSLGATEFPAIPNEPGPEALAVLLHATAAVPIRYRDALLGVLAVTSTERLSTTDRTVLRDVADHAGLLMHNALLTDRLAVQVDRLADLARRLGIARRTLVSAQDAERRRLERNLHDGVQQHLVAAIIALRNREPQAGRDILGAARRELAALATGARPAALAEGGIAGALQRSADLTRRSGTRVSVNTDLTGLLDADPAVREAAEEAAYFCCAEALQNIAKYAGPCTATVTVDGSGGDIRFAVTDDGRGFDPAALDDSDGGRIGGIARLSERVAPLGGFVVAESATGRGTRIAGRIPVRGTAGSGS